MKNSKIILINKRAGVSSHTVIKEVQKKYNFKKIGHAGTLDPMAEGLLIAMSNNATKLSDLLMKKNKTYVVKMELGYETDTLDSEGTILKKANYNVDLTSVNKVLKEFIGESYQIPPMFSAIKYKGQKLYKLARKNIQVELTQRKIFIESFENVEYNKGIISFKVTVSSGTYIRSLVRDIAYKLKTYGTMIYLLRERIDKLCVPQNDEITFYNVQDYFKLNKINLNFNELMHILNGMTLKMDKNIPEESLHCYFNDEYLGIVNVINSNKIKKSKFFVTKEDYEKSKKSCNSCCGDRD